MGRKFWEKRKEEEYKKRSEGKKELNEAEKTLD